MAIFKGTRHTKSGRHTNTAPHGQSVAELKTAVSPPIKVGAFERPWLKPITCQPDCLPYPIGCRKRPSLHMTSVRILAHTFFT